MICRTNEARRAVTSSSSSSSTSTSCATRHMSIANASLFPGCLYPAKLPRKLGPCRHQEDDRSQPPQGAASMTRRSTQRDPGGRHSHRCAAEWVLRTSAPRRSQTTRSAEVDGTSTRASTASPRTTRLRLCSTSLACKFPPTVNRQPRASEALKSDRITAGSGSVSNPAPGRATQRAITIVPRSGQGRARHGTTWVRRSYWKVGNSPSQVGPTRSASAGPKSASEEGKCAAARMQERKDVVDTAVAGVAHDPGRSRRSFMSKYNLGLVAARWIGRIGRCAMAGKRERVSAGTRAGTGC
ncbi:hypothetical protein C8Q73DRAFT_449977 [Cubamyces lactineus]|nr:hypothetical protein C8Q73DRAFT_449977 [Cubamyces lactineus]